MSNLQKIIFRNLPPLVFKEYAFNFNFIEIYLLLSESFDNLLAPPIR